MRTTITIGKISGIPIKIHFNWFITAVLVTWSLSAGYYPLEYPGWSIATYWIFGTITAFLFFLSVLLHELGHAQISLRERVPVQSITLFLFGGVAHIANEPETPGSEFRIVAAGPGTSLLLAFFFFLIYWFEPLGQRVGEMAIYLTRINVILAVFNLIPGFPLDGGRILRSILWKITDDFYRATRWATRTGMSIAGFFVIGGMALIALGNLIGGVWVVFIGGYLGTVAYSASRSSTDEQVEEGKEPFLTNDAYHIPSRTYLQDEKTVPSRVLQNLKDMKPQGAMVFVPVPVEERRERTVKIDRR